MLPKISLLILNYNGLDITPIILNSIQKLKYPLQKIETIVIDNASTDGSVEMIEKNYPFAKIIKLEKNVAYGAFNEGVKQCQGEFCFLLNNDMEIDPECLGELISLFKKYPDAVIAGPAIYNFKTRKLMYTQKYISRTFYQGADHFEDLNEEKSMKEERETYTGVPFLKTSFARSLNYVFDPDYFLFVEDIDLAYRIRMLGHTFYRAPKAKLYHDCNATTKLFFANTQLNYLVERNTLQTFLKDVQTRNLFLWMPLFFVPRFLKLTTYLFTFQVPFIKSTLNAWWWNAHNLRKTYKKRKIIQSQRKVTDKVIFSAMGNERAVLRYMFNFRVAKTKLPHSEVNTNAKSI